MMCVRFFTSDTFANKYFFEIIIIVQRNSTLNKVLLQYIKKKESYIILYNMKYEKIQFTFNLTNKKIV